MLAGDISLLSTADLPGQPTLAWASFPCQDLSAAGRGLGLTGSRSGTFWAFWKHMESLKKEYRAPKIIVLENVCGAITSNQGRDFSVIAESLVNSGYRVGAIIIDAVHFVPQSRPRLFIIAVEATISISEQLIRTDPSGLWHPRNIVEAKYNLSAKVQEAWVWWNLPHPPIRGTTFATVIESEPTGVKWNSEVVTQSLLSMMTPVNLLKVQKAQSSGELKIGALYKRTRNGLCRAEVRFDDVAGCLRTPTGGSSRQTIMVIKGRSIQTRLLSSREAARLMGLPENYTLPKSYNEAYHLVGDGVAVPVVEFLNQTLLQPIAESLSIDAHATSQKQA